MCIVIEFKAKQSIMRPLFIILIALCMSTSCTEEEQQTFSLYYPPEGSLLDNGRTDHLDSVVWDFRWPEVKSASKYNLYVINQAALNPIIDMELSRTTYHHARWGGYISDRNRYGWVWKVRAMVDGKWLDWSPLINFDIEPVNTD